MRRPHSAVGREVVVVGVNGVFGERMCDVSARCGAEVVAVREEWGRPIDPQQLLEAHPSPKVIALVHAETSTGVRNDVEPLGDRKGDDAISLDQLQQVRAVHVLEQIGTPAAREVLEALTKEQMPAVVGAEVKVVLKRWKK